MDDRGTADSRTAHQIGQRDSEGVRERIAVAQRKVALTTFDRTDVCTVEARPMCQSLLAHLLLNPQPAYLLAEPFKMRLYLGTS